MAEITTQDQVASTDETLEQGNEQAGESQQPSQIPKKFVGKSNEEILRAYNDLERHTSKISSERADERKQREALENRMRDLESRLAAQPNPQAVQHDRIEESDPLADYDEQFESNPKEAIKTIVKKVAQKADQRISQSRMETEQADATRYYNEKMNSDPDFAKLSPKMQQIAREYADLVRPEKLTSVKSLMLLHLAARGSTVDNYVSEAVSKAKKEGISVREEKRGASSESGGTSGGKDSVNFADLSLEEMEKFLGRSDE